MFAATVFTSLMFKLGFHNVLGQEHTKRKMASRNKHDHSAAAAAATTTTTAEATVEEAAVSEEVSSAVVEEVVEEAEELEPEE